MAEGNHNRSFDRGVYRLAVAEPRDGTVRKIRGQLADSVDAAVSGHANLLLRRET
ncbi:hypothetical protein D3C85_1945170 [compost metagenome]